MRPIDAEKKMSELVDKQKIIHEAERLANDFKDCDGGSTCFCIDGNEYHTDTGYAIDGIDAYVEVFTERINALQPAQPEIIHCCECKWLQCNMRPDGYLPKGVDEFECRHWCGYCDPMDFCSYAERARDDE